MYADHVPVPRGRQVARYYSGYNPSGYGDYGIAPLVVAGATSLLKGILGHHNNYDQGNPHNLEKFDVMANAAKGGDALNLDGLHKVSQGATLNMGPYAGGWGNPFMVNWGEDTLGRGVERKYAGDMWNAIVQDSRAMTMIPTTPALAPSTPAAPDVRPVNVPTPTLMPGATTAPFVPINAALPSANQAADQAQRSGRPVRGRAIMSTPTSAGPAVVMGPAPSVSVTTTAPAAQQASVFGNMPPAVLVGAGLLALVALTSSRRGR